MMDVWKSNEKENEKSKVYANPNGRAKPNAAEIRALRIKLHMSQGQFSKSFGIPIRTIQGWEQGKSEAAPYIVYLLTEVCKARGLIEDEKENDRES